MKKIPTLFTRIFYTEEEKAEGKNGIKAILPELSSPDLKEVLKNGTPTIKWDGACVLIKDGILYKRYDAKNGKTPPLGSLPCEPAPDPITGHWPHWIKIDCNKPEDKWFCEAYEKLKRFCVLNRLTVSDGTYEAIGPHWQRNPYHLSFDILVKHGEAEIFDFYNEEGFYTRTFEGIKKWLEDHNEEGIVFWYNEEPKCKIKRTDFGIPWNGYEDCRILKFNPLSDK